jgi:thiamine pyrophosphate-dependent acetolactate synthase large subunit-like protein
MGCEGINVATAPALEAALSNGRGPGRPLVIGAEIDPAQYTAQF